MIIKYSARLGILLISLFSFYAQAFVVTVSEKQLNAMLQMSFPIQQTYQQVAVTFSNPQVKLDALDKEVSITANITAIQGGKTLQASGTIEGVLDYDDFAQTLEYEKPKLTEFKVISNEISAADEAIRHIKQTIGQNLPVIILVDFNKLKFGFGDIVPKDIDITPKGLTITL